MRACAPGMIISSTRAGADAMAPVPESVLSVGATLGEGPVWVARDAALWFVDIKQKRIYRFDHHLGVARSWDAPSTGGWKGRAREGLFAVGVHAGVGRVDAYARRF